MWFCEILFHFCRPEKLKSLSSTLLETHKCYQAVSCPSDGKSWGTVISMYSGQVAGFTWGASYIFLFWKVVLKSCSESCSTKYTAIAKMINKNILSMTQYDSDSVWPSTCCQIHLKIHRWDFAISFCRPVAGTRQSINMEPNKVRDRFPMTTSLKPSTGRDELRWNW